MNPRVVKITAKVPEHIALAIRELAENSKKDVRKFTGMLVYKGLESLMESSKTPPSTDK